MFKINLESKEIKIRPMKEADLDFFSKLRNKCRGNLHDQRKFSLKQVQSWFANNNPNYYIVEFLGIKAGYIRTSNWDLDKKTAYVGIDLEPNFRNLGIAGKALRLFIDYLFIVENFNQLELEVLDFNKDAIKLYLSLGFVERGRRKHQLGNDREIQSILMVLRASG